MSSVEWRRMSDQGQAKASPGITRFNLWRAAALVLAAAWIENANFVPYFDFGWPIRVENYHPATIWWAYALLDGLIAVAVIAIVYRLSGIAFQNARNHLRLSTLVVLMLMGGSVLWLNMKPHATEEAGVYWYGWPVYVWHTNKRVPSALAFFFHNLLVASSVLFGTACVFELMIPKALKSEQ